MRLTSELRRHTARPLPYSIHNLPSCRLPPAEPHIEQQECDELKQRVRSALDDTNYRVLRRIEIDSCEGRITLKGSVGSYYEKQKATAVVLSLDGVDELRNELCVSARRVSD